MAIGSLFSAGLFSACHEKGEEKETAKDSGKPADVAASEPVLRLDLETQKRIGLQVALLTATNLSREVKGYGRVLDPAPLAALATELEFSQIAASASGQEFARLKILSVQTNASVRALQTAEAVARRDQLLVDSTRDRIIAAWGKAVATRSDGPAFVRSLSASDNLLVRVDLAAGEALSAPPLGARLVPLTAEDKSVDAEFLGMAPRVDAETQGRGFLFRVKTNPLGLAPGAAVTGFLKVPGEALSGVVAPRPAVVRHADQTWLYVRTGADQFTRRKVTLAFPLEQGWLVTAGFTVNDSVVISGAQLLLSEELKSQMKNEE